MTNRYQAQAKMIAQKPDEEITVGDLAKLVTHAIAGLQKLIVLAGIIGSLYIGFHSFFGGVAAESPGAVQRTLQTRIERQDSMHHVRMDGIEDIAVIALGQNQQQSYQICMSQPRAVATTCA